MTIKFLTIKVITLSLIFVKILHVNTLHADPFPHGRLMMSQGAVIDTEGESGREGWSPAALYRDTLSYGVSLALTSYYSGWSSQRYTLGGFYDAGSIVIKGALSQFDFMRVYYEQDVILSAGTSWRMLSFGGDVSMRRIGLYDSNDDRIIFMFGTSLLYRIRRITADVSAKNILTISDDVAGVAPPFSAAFRISTIRSRFGAQGVLLEITPSYDAPFRFIAAQEYGFGNDITFGASISSNPTMIAFGITFGASSLSSSLPSNITSGAAFVNHPYLGWSKGMYFDYSR